jgi:hypothetical protein
MALDLVDQCDRAHEAAAAPAFLVVLAAVFASYVAADTLVGALAVYLRLREQGLGREAP